jgi:hypothetical protein
MPPKRKVASTTVYVLFVVEHVDCYKRADSSGKVIGVFDSEDKAVRAALTSNPMWNQFEDNDLDHENIHLRKYKKNKAIPKTESDRKLLFEKVVQVQNDQHGEYTMRGSGEYFSIVKMAIE